MIITIIIVIIMNTVFNIILTVSDIVIKEILWLEGFLPFWAFVLLNSFIITIIIEL